jgi:hypothetical protein
MWRLNSEGTLNFNKLGRWWCKSEEIDIVAFDSTGDEIVFAECKFTKSPMDADIFYDLLRKSALVPWRSGERRERFVLFCVSGFTKRLQELAEERDDVVLFDKK